MKVSLDWIKDYVALPADTDLNRLAYDLTMSTVEVENVEHLAERFAPTRTNSAFARPTWADRPRTSSAAAATWPPI